MAKWVAFLTGMILSCMVYFNGQLSALTSITLSNAIFHGIGFVFYGSLMSFAVKNKEKTSLSWRYILPGAMGSMTVLLNNYVIASLGVTLMVAYGLFGQVLSSLVIDTFGFLGKAKQKVSHKQVLGILVMATGLVIMMI